MHLALVRQRYSAYGGAERFIERTPHRLAIFCGGAGLSGYNSTFFQRNPTRMLAAQW